MPNPGNLVAIEVGFIQKRSQRSSLIPGRSELLQFLSVLAILHQDDLKNRLICTIAHQTAYAAVTGLNPASLPIKDKQLMYMSKDSSSYRLFLEFDLFPHQPLRTAVKVGGQVYFVSSNNCIKTIFLVY